MTSPRYRDLLDYAEDSNKNIEGADVGEFNGEQLTLEQEFAIEQAVREYAKKSDDELIAAIRRLTADGNDLIANLLIHFLIARMEGFRS